MGCLYEEINDQERKESEILISRYYMFWSSIHWTNRHANSNNPVYGDTKIRLRKCFWEISWVYHYKPETQI